MSEDVQEAAPIRTFGPRKRRAAAAFLLEVYRGDPAFAELYDLQPSQLECLAPTFRLHLESMRWLYRASLGFFDGQQLQGAVCYFPRFELSRRQIAYALLRHPITNISNVVRSRYLNLRHRTRLPEHAQRRWQTYIQLVDEGSQASEPVARLQVISLAVAAAARRQGIARQLIDTIASEPHWQQQIQAIEVNTWHAANADIYERLGFTTVHQAQRDGVACWTMRRPL